MSKSFALPTLILLVTLFVCYIAQAQEKPNEKYYPEPSVYKQSDDMLKDSSTKGPIDVKPEIFVQMGHTATGYTSNTVAVFSPGGKYIFSGNDDGKMIMWEAETGREVKSFRCGDSVTDLTLSSDGRYVLSGDNYFGNNINLWDIASGKKIKSFNIRVLNGPPLVFCNDDKYFLSGGTDELIKLWNIESGEMIREYRAISTDPVIKPEVTSLVLTPDGKKFIAGYRYNGQEPKGNTVRVWDINSGENILSFNDGNGWVEALAITPDGKYVYSGDWDQDSVRVWEVKTGKYIKSFFTGGTSALEISAGGRYFLAGGCMSFCLVEIKSGKVIRRIDKGINGWVQSIKFSPDGRYVILGDQVPQPKMWDLMTGELIRTYGGYAGQTRTAEVTKSGSILMTAHGYSNSLSIWDYKNASLLKTIKNDKKCLLSSASISKDGSLVAFGGWDMTADNSNVILWDFINSKKKFQISPDERSGAHTKSMIISDDGRRLTWAAGVNIIVSDAENGHEIKKYSHVGQFGIEKISTDAAGRYILADDQSDTKLIDCKTGAVVKTFNEKCLFSGNGEKLYLLKEDFERNVIILREIDLNSLQDKQFTKISFNGKIVEGDVTRFRYIQNITAGQNPDYLFFSDDENFYKIDLKKSEIIAFLIVNSYFVKNIETTPDGKFLCSSSHDGTTRFWDIETGKELARFISFSDGEWIVITPEGYFNASVNGAKYLNVRVGKEVYSIDNFYEKYYNPAYVASVLQGNKVEAAADIRKGILPPPAVRIISPEPGKVFTSDAATITVSAKDMGGGIDEIRLYHNGKAIGEDIRGIKIVPQGAAAVKTYTVTLVDGLNTFQATAFSKDRTESNPYQMVVTLAAPQKDISLYVLAVGINTYKNPALSLNYAEPDARGIVDFFKKKGTGLFKQVYINDIYNDQATKTGIITMFTRLQNTNPQDVVLIYLAGHGENVNDKWYFIPYELTYPEREEDVKAQGLSSEELAGFIKKIKAQKVLVLIDACKAGEALVAFRGFEDRKALSQLSRSTGVHIVAASTKSQFAAEVRELGHGVFTYTLLEGLNGKAALKGETITVRKLMGYIEEQLPEITKKYKQEAQYPVVDSRGMDFPLVISK